MISIKTKKIVISLLLLVFFLFLSFALLKYWSNQKVFGLKNKQIITLDPNERLPKLAEKLYKKNLINNQRLFIWWTKLQGRYKFFQSGTYAFQGPVSPNTIISSIINGKSYHPVSLEITIPEGFSLQQILNRLTKLGFSFQDLYDTAHDPEFLQSIQLNGSSLEGFLYPSTYSYYNKKLGPKQIFKRMVSKFFKQLPHHYEDKLKKQGLSLSEAVTIASLIEKETSVVEEKPLIASVILNRLKKKIPLGIDASVIYGIQNFKGTLNSTHLKDVNNPYNTRIHYGLPPSPICSPSLSSIQAVLNPSKHNFYYYVLLPGKNQRYHHFSKTLTEHNRYVKKRQYATNSKNTPQD